MEPGLHDISHADYHQDPCPSPSLSASLGKLMLERSPQHAWWEHPRLGGDKTGQPRSRAVSGKRNVLLGQAAHAVALEDSWDSIEIVTGYDDFKKKDARERRDAALAAERVPILEPEADRVREMARELQANEWCAELLHGQREKTVTWIEASATTIAWCRARIDVLKPSGAIVDFKTTELAPTGNGWGRRQIWEYALQVGLYRRGVAALRSSDEPPPFLFVVQEVDPPFGAGIFEFPPEAYEYADRLAERAVRTWARCVTENSWPVYPADMIVPEAPFWMREALIGETA